MISMIVKGWIATWAEEVLTHLHRVPEIFGLIITMRLVALTVRRVGFARNGWCLRVAIVAFLSWIRSCILTVLVKCVMWKGVDSGGRAKGSVLVAVTIFIYVSTEEHHYNDLRQVTRTVSNGDFGHSVDDRGKWLIVWLYGVTMNGLSWAQQQTIVRGSAKWMSVQSGQSKQKEWQFIQNNKAKLIMQTKKWTLIYRDQYSPTQLPRGAQYLRSSTALSWQQEHVHRLGARGQLSHIRWWPQPWHRHLFSLSSGRRTFLLQQILRFWQL